MLKSAHADEERGLQHFHEISKSFFEYLNAPILS